jgi:hypothetical protein
MSWPVWPRADHTAAAPVARHGPGPSGADGAAQRGAVADAAARVARAGGILTAARASRAIVRPVEDPWAIAQNMARSREGRLVDRFIDTLIGKEVYVKLAKDWSVQGRLARVDADGLVLERAGIPPILVRLGEVGTIEEAQ